MQLTKIGLNITILYSLFTEVTSLSQRPQKARDSRIQSQARSVVLEIGGHFRAQGASDGEGSGGAASRKMFVGHAHFSLGNAHFLSEELFPTSYLFLFLCSFFK